MTFEEKRNKMVETQLLPRGIIDPNVLRAMSKVKRHLFLDENMREKAYDDMALPIGMGQTISQPYMVAVMTELLELKGNERVLEIGTGSGYQAAVLAEIVKEVFSVERIAEISKRTGEKLKDLAYDNIHLKTSDGTLGWPEKSPFDRILITAAAPYIPDLLKEQISIGGMILAPVGEKFSQKLVKLKKLENKFNEESHVPCIFVPLIGRYGWEE